MDKLLPVILKNTYTLGQFKKRLRLLQDSFQQGFFNGPAFKPQSAEDENWLKSLPKEFMDFFNKENLSQTLASLTTQVATLPTITIYLAFEATDEALEQIGLKARSVFGENYLLDIKYNPSLIAGCSLSFKGRLKDYSLHAKILENKQAILDSFKKFLR
jgi:hypothetical protein